MPEYTLEDYIRLLATHASIEVRRNAAWQLGRYHDLRGLAPLIQAADDPASEVRLRVMEALGAFRDEAVLAPLLAGLRDPDPDVRAMAGQALGAVGDPRASEGLLSALQDPHAPTRASVAGALGLVGALGAGESLLRAMLADEDEGVRYAARQSLVRLHDDDTTQAMLSALATLQDALDLTTLIEVLVQRRTTQALPALRALLGHEDEGVRLTAAWAVKALGG
jgi:HEAT repeat protein